MVASALASLSPCGRCPSTSSTDERMLSLMKLWPDVLWSRPAAAWTPSSSLTTSSTTISGGITRLAKLPSRWPLMLHGNNLYFFRIRYFQPHDTEWHSYPWPSCNCLDLCNGWKVWLNGTTSVLKSVPCLVLNTDTNISLTLSNTNVHCYLSMKYLRNWWHLSWIILNVAFLNVQFICDIFLCNGFGVWMNRTSNETKSVLHYELEKGVWGLLYKTFFASLKWNFEPKWSLNGLR